METPEHQEWRSRQKVSWRAIWQIALSAGAIVFIMSGGSPWSTAGTMNAVMGRDLPWGFFTLLGLHFLVAYVYVAVIAHVIYRLRLVAALLAGLATGLALYTVNYAFFHGLPVQMQSPEFRAIFVHVTFSLLAAAGYKAASVPRPIRGSRDQVNATTPRRSSTSARDPEPDVVKPAHLPERGRRWRERQRS